MRQPDDEIAENAGPFLLPGYGCAAFATCRTGSQSLTAALLHCPSWSCLVPIPLAVMNRNLRRSFHQSRLDRSVEVLQRRLVAAEQHVVLGAGIEAPLHPFRERKILL